MIINFNTSFFLNSDSTGTKKNARKNKQTYYSQYENVVGEQGIFLSVISFNSTRKLKWFKKKKQETPINFHNKRINFKQF